MPDKKTFEEIQQSMAKLQAVFFSKLQQKSEFIVQLAEKLQLNDLSELQSLISMTHQLAGSCGAFHFNHLGHLARQILELSITLSKQKEPNPALLQELMDAVKTFVTEVEQGAPDVSQQVSNSLFIPEIQNNVWLVLPPSELREELNSQLSAFGYPVKMFSNFNDCCIALQTDAPALLFCAAFLEDHYLFKQINLLHVASEKKSKLMIYADEDSFEVRIDAVRHNALGCLVLPIDIPSMLQRVSKLFDEVTFSDQKVSILDDDLLLAEQYSLILKAAEIEVQIISDPSKVISDLLSFKPDILLLDMQMPTISGAEISGVIRQYDALSSLHVTFLSAEHDFQQQLQAMSFGADDFITKPISNENLVHAVKLRLARNKEIKSLIVQDSLTGLIRHGAIKEAVVSEFDRMNRSGEHLCVAMIDLDHFKNVNDSHGHAVGDVVIGTIATLLRKRIRRSDRAGRYGGEEFMILLPNCTAQNAQLLLKSILKSFRAIHFKSSPNNFSCTFSAGISCSSMGFESAEMLMNAADKALYEAKKNGRNQVNIFSDHQNASDKKLSNN